MTTVEAVEQLECLESLERLLRHLNLVQQACEVMGKKLIRNGDVDFGLKLVALGRIHDISKFNSDEWTCLCRHKSDNSNDLHEMIDVHRSRNPHHPEYHGDIRRMPREHLWEMVADIWARSVELGGDVRKYLFSVLAVQHGFVDLSDVDNRRVWKELEMALTFLLEAHL